MIDPWGAPPPPKRRSIWLWLLLSVGGLIVVLAWLFPSALDSEDGMMRVIYLVALLALVSGGVLMRRRVSFAKGVRNGAIWLSIGVALVALYSYRFEFGDVRDRIVGELMPGHGVPTGEGAVRFRAGENGHFRVNAEVDGARIRFLVDTGASNVVLSAGDARRLGFNLRSLTFSQIYSTANGDVRGAPVRLREIRIGPIRVANVAGSVTTGPVGESLLGMSFLECLQGFEISGGTLTLRQ